MLIKMTTKPVGCSILYYSFFCRNDFSSRSEWTMKTHLNRMISLIECLWAAMDWPLATPSLHSRPPLVFTAMFEQWSATKPYVKPITMARGVLCSVLEGTTIRVIMSVIQRGNPHASKDGQTQKQTASLVRYFNFVINVLLWGEVCGG